MSESERREAYQRASAHLPMPDTSNWVWSEREVDILRKACAVRFGETLRTESLFYIAMAGIRMAMARAQESDQ